MNEYAIFGLLAGLAVGIIPVVLGATRDKLGLGIGGFFACALSGAALGLLLAVPVCGIFVWSIVRASPGNGSDRRKCPFCAELVSREARICKHCQRELSDPRPPMVP